LFTFLLLIGHDYNSFWKQSVRIIFCSRPCSRITVSSGSGWRHFVVLGVPEMNDSTQSNLPILLWPFYAVWRLLTFVLNVIGRLVSALLGIGLMIAGVSITLSVVGAPLGIPLASLGFLLLIRALF